MPTLAKILPKLRATLFFSVLLLVIACDRVEEATSPSVPEGADEISGTAPLAGRRGGRLVVALRAEPRTLNPVVAADNVSETVLRRMMADLIHINAELQETEPALAESWEISEDGRRFTMNLREDVFFSDGEPFDADDVLFTFKVYLDQRVGSRNREQLMINGKPIAVRKLDKHRVEFELAMPYASGERLFDSIAMLPQHLLEDSYDEGELRNSWGVSVDPEQIAGLGPFRLREYRAGERLVLERNPYYWKYDKAGNRLPYLDEVIFIFVGSDDAQVIRFQAGETDVIDGLSAEAFAALDRKPNGAYRLMDIGPGLNFDFLFFNLNEISISELNQIKAKQVWFRNRGFRRAVSMAVDRAGILQLVYQGRATPLWTTVTPSNKRWFNSKIPRPERSVQRAREYLENAGFRWDQAGRLIDEGSKVVEFSIATGATNSQRLQAATIIQKDMNELGIQVRIVPLEQQALIERIVKTFDYEACIFGLRGWDTDPNGQLNILLSNGTHHFWRLGQEKAATSWEFEIDRLMSQQSITRDYPSRKALFDRVQEIMVENMPVIFITSPHVLVGAKSGLGNFKPAILGHFTLWNVEELFWENGLSLGEVQ